jgi:hypothetical protein
MRDCFLNIGGENGARSRSIIAVAAKRPIQQDEVRA